MGRPNKRKRKKRERAASRAIRIRVRRVELALAYDGWLRGAPEPVLLFAIYRIVGDDITLLSRSTIRVPAGAGPGQVVELDELALEAQVPMGDGMRILLLVAAVEEDGGEGVARVYADLEAPSTLQAWAVDAAVPEPRSLLEWACQEPPPAPATARVHLVDASGDLRDRDLGDDWIGAAVVQVTPTLDRGAERRLRFVSEDGKNDWTAVVELR